MRMFLANLGLALLWAAASGRLNIANLVAGYALGYLVLALVQPLVGSSRYFAKVRQVLAFAGYFLYEVVRANLRVAHDVITPTHYARPGVVAIPLEPMTDGDIALLACLVTLTPGTLALEVSPDRRTLFIHAMFIEDPERTCREIKEGIERRLLELVR